MLRRNQEWPQDLPRLFLLISKVRRNQIYLAIQLSHSGDAVYLSLSSYNALYNVTVRGRTTTFGASDSRVIPSNCSLSFGQAALAGQSNAIEVIISGPSLDSAGQWSFAMEKIV